MIAIELVKSCQLVNEKKMKNKVDTGTKKWADSRGNSPGFFILSSRLLRYRVSLGGVLVAASAGDYSLGRRDRVFSHTMSKRINMRIKVLNK